MTSQIKDLVQFYAQQYNVPIECASEPWELETWDKSGLLIGMPEETNDADDKKVDKLAFGHDPEFGKQLGGDLVVIHDLPMARIGTRSIVFLFLPTNKTATELARRILEERLPRMCRTYRHEMRDQLVTGITSCVQDRRKELQSSIREDSYELERLSLQMMQLSRKLETDRQVLALFEKAPDWIRARATRTFVDLMKLVPGTYASFRIEDDVVVGNTNVITINYDGVDYVFQPFNVELNLCTGKVSITGGSDTQPDYPHPHVSSDSICWGNCEHLIRRLVGELDLAGFFILVNEFLGSYNSSDPYMRIEKYDPNWEEDEDQDEEPYCSWCDSYGHEISECESCWWCPYCDQYDDHSEEDCPNRPQEQTEEVIHAVETPA